ncbi:MAG: nicotinamide riboside transporter PnuC [Brevinema sp.]
MIITIIKQNIFLFFYTLCAVVLIAVGIFIDWHHASTIHSKIGLGLSTFNSLFAIFFVILEIKEKFSMFIVSLIASFFNILYLWFYSPLIWDISLSMVYIIISIYNIINWNKKQLSNANFENTAPKYLSWKQTCFYTVLSTIIIVLLFIIGYRIGKYTSMLQACADSITTALSILGWWLISRKYIAAWYLWIIVNMISVPLYISVGSYTLAMMFISYIIISFYGWKCWQHSIK